MDCVSGNDVVRVSTLEGSQADSFKGFSLLASEIRYHYQHSEDNKAA